MIACPWSVPPKIDPAHYLRETGAKEQGHHKPLIAGDALFQDSTGSGGRARQIKPFRWKKVANVAINLRRSELT
jgi:hypothetical protein